MKQYADGSTIRITQSPITEFIVDCAIDILSTGKSMIVEFPSSFSESSLFVANSFTYQNKKSTIIFTDSSTIKRMNDDYYHLYDGNVPLRLRVPIGIKTDSGIKLKVSFLKGARTQIKSSLREDYQKALNSSNRSILILASNDENLDKIEGEIFDEDVKSPSLAIFNNIPFNHDSRINKIMQWCKKNNLQFLILTSYIAPKYYNEIPEDVAILPIHNGLLNSSNFDNIALREKFESSYYQSNSELFNRFNIDRPHHYVDSQELIYEEINNGASLVKCLHEMAIVIRHLPNPSKTLYHELLQLLYIGNEAVDSFTPIRSLTKYSSVANCRINGEQFCDVISKLASSEDSDTESLCSQLVSNFKTIWNTLDQCKSPIYDRGYKKDNKFTRLLTVLESNEGKFDKIYVVPTNKTELNTIHKLLNTVIPDKLEHVIICSPSNLEEIDYSNCLMILSGKPALNELFITNYSFSKIIVLAYHESNVELIKNTIELFNHVGNYCSDIFVSSLAKLQTCSDKVTKHLDKVPSLRKINTHTPSTNGLSQAEKLNEINKEIVKKYPDLREYLSTLSTIDTYRKTYDDQVTRDYIQDLQRLPEYYVVTLENIDSGESATMYSSIKSNHPFYINDDFEEKPITPDLIGEIIIDVPGKHNDLLNMLLDLYGYRDKIDYETVEMWEECMTSFDRDGPHAVSNFYDLYVSYGGKKQKQTVRLWLNRTLLGPSDVEDLVILGNALGNEDLSKNAKYIFKELELIRNYKRALGRRLCRIIGMILNNKPDVAEDPFTATIVENVKAYLFRISKITHIKEGKIVDEYQ